MTLYGVISSIWPIFMIINSLCKFDYDNYCFLSIPEDRKKSSIHIIQIGEQVLFQGEPFHCTAHQCTPLWGKFMECSIFNPALPLLVKHPVIGQLQKAPNFLAFHWSPHGSLVSIGQHFVTTRVETNSFL